MQQEITNKSLAKWSIAAVFAWGLLAHAAGFLDFTLSHDVLQEYFLSYSLPIKIAAGRFMEPLLRLLMGEYVTLFWLSGVVSLLAIGVAVFVMTKMFSLKKVWQIILLGGVCVTNISITATVASFMHDFMGNAIGLLLAVCAAYEWTQLQQGISWKHTLIGAACLVVSLGFYQAYLAVTITLMCIYCIRALLSGHGAKDTVAFGLRALPMLLLALVVYVGIVVITASVFDISLRQNGIGGLLENEQVGAMAFVKDFVKGYGLTIVTFLLPNYASAQAVYEPTALLIGGINIALLVCGICIAIGEIRRKKLGKGEVALLIALVLFLPVCMSCVMVVSGVFHELVRFAMYLFYLLVLVVFQFAPAKTEPEKKDWKKLVIIGLVGFIICNNVQLANMAYARKNLQKQATLSAITRITHQLESYEGYVYGQSKVALIGHIFTDDAGWDNDALSVVAGLNSTNQLNHHKYSLQYLQNYFDVVLQYPIDLCDNEEIAILSETEAFQAMPVFPNPGSIAEINGVVVVKLNEW